MQKWVTMVRKAMTTARHTRATFKALVEPQLPTLYRLARRLARTREDAEDLVQETCLKGFRAFHRFELGSDCKAWLITILINTFRDWARKSMKHPQPVGYDDFADFYSQLQNHQTHGVLRDPEEIAE
jgi:RNA polymerase sigma-70 factor (ECF subfamily)